MTCDVSTPCPRRRGKGCVGGLECSAQDIEVYDLGGVVVGGTLIAVVLVVVELLPCIIFYTGCCAVWKIGLDESSEGVVVHYGGNAVVGEFFLGGEVVGVAVPGFVLFNGEAFVVVDGFATC